MEAQPEKEITHLLQAWGEAGDPALAILIPLIHDELRRLARRYMHRERAGHTLQTSALVNEAYLRLRDTKSVHWSDRAHFFAVAASIMRRILVDAARTKQNRQHGGSVVRVPLEEEAIVSPERSLRMVALDDALQRLAGLNPRQSRIVEMRYFGGLSEAEIAAVLKVSDRTVRNDWSLARAWLFRELGRSEVRNDS